MDPSVNSLSLKLYDSEEIYVSTRIWNAYSAIVQYEILIKLWDTSNLLKEIVVI